MFRPRNLTWIRRHIRPPSLHNCELFFYTSIILYLIGTLQWIVWLQVPFRMPHLYWVKWRKFPTKNGNLIYKVNFTTNCHQPMPDLFVSGSIFLDVCRPRHTAGEAVTQVSYIPTPSSVNKPTYVLNVCVIICRYTPFLKVASNDSYTEVERKYVLFKWT